MSRVCHMTCAHAEKDERIYYKECVSLAAAGYDVYQVARGDNFEEQGVHGIGVGEIPKSRIKRMLKGTRMVYQKALELDADLYHFHDPELLPYGLKLKRKGKKVIFDSHEFTEAQIVEKKWIPRGMRKMVGFLYSRYQKKICKQFDAIITATSYVTEAFRKYHNTVVTIGNYPVLQDNPVVPAGDKGAYIGFAGNLMDQWNHDKLITAIGTIPEVKYILCAPPVPSELNKLQQLKGWEKVEYLGRIPHPEVQGQYARCFAGVSLLTPGANTGNQIGNMGNTKIFEQMMAGLPVICTDFILWRDFVDRYHCGICLNPQNVNEIGDAIRYLLSHPQEAHEMGENGRRAIKEEFNWGIEEQKLLRLYQKLLKQ